MSLQKPLFFRFGDKFKPTLNIEPTHTFDEKLSITEAGFDLVLYHAPGETNDQIIIHWPEKDVLFPADNIYKVLESVLLNLTKDRNS